MKKFTAFVLVFLAFLATPASLSAQALSSVPASRLAHLRHGVNITGWFAQSYGSDGYSKEHFQNFATSVDLSQIRKMGFDHVRLGVDPGPHLFHPNDADNISAEYLGYLDEAVKNIIEQGLAVVLDIHAETQFKEKFDSDDFVQRFADFWRALARHFSKINPDLMFFEVLNEPDFPKSYRWDGIQARLAAAIREGAPAHTIIAVGDHDASLEGLLSLEPLRDPNVIYSFHYYEPHIFTHQGADWGPNYSHYLSGVPYPSNPESAKKAAALVPSSDALDRYYIARYGMEHWNAERIDADVSQAAEWARTMHVPVICDEFGVYKKTAPPEDRSTWIRDVRRSLEHHGIGWTIWDYSSDGFGVVSKKGASVTADDATLRALGLE